MGDSGERNGHGTPTRVLFCGPYWPASTNYTKEYLQDYPFIQVSYSTMQKICLFMYLLIKMHMNVLADCPLFLVLFILY